jgi:threonine synthase
MGNLNKLVVATNSNDILARFWRSGRYEQVDSTPTLTPDGGLGDGKPAAADGGVQATLSQAMDILVSSNFEHLLWYWYLAFESSNTAPESSRRASTGATIDGWMKRVKTNVLKFMSRCSDWPGGTSWLSVYQMIRYVSCVRSNRVTRFNNPSPLLRRLKR